MCVNSPNFVMITLSHSMHFMPQFVKVALSRPCRVSITLASGVPCWYCPSPRSVLSLSPVSLGSVPLVMYWSRSCIRVEPSSTIVGSLVSSSLFEMSSISMRSSCDYASRLHAFSSFSCMYFSLLCAISASIWDLSCS